MLLPESEVVRKRLLIVSFCLKHTRISRVCPNDRWPFTWKKKTNRGWGDTEMKTRWTVCPVLSCRLVNSVWDVSLLPLLFDPQSGGNWTWNPTWVLLLWDVMSTNKVGSATGGKAEQEECAVFLPDSGSWRSSLKLWAGEMKETFHLQTFHLVRRVDSDQQVLPGLMMIRLQVSVHLNAFYLVFLFDCLFSYWMDSFNRIKSGLSDTDLICSLSSFRFILRSLR